MEVTDEVFESKASVVFQEAEKQNAYNQSSDADIGGILNDIRK